jgi:hypothetical protein
LTAAADDSIYDGIASRVRVYTVAWLAEPPKPKLLQARLQPSGAQCQAFDASA